VLTILHGSDLQCGKPYRPGAAEAFRAAARALEPDLVVIAGDLTQRAKSREYGAVRAYLDGFGSIPVVVTPGNHDVPLYRIWERLAVPYRNWRRHIGPALDSVTRVPGALVVALNSSAPRRAIVGGRIDAGQVAFAGRALEDAGPGEAKVLVIHHHFVPGPDGEGGRPLPNARALLARFEAMGVDLILGGHIHQTHLTTSRALLPGGDGPGIPLVRCGTTASRRGRGAEAGRNSFNLVRVTEHEVVVVPHLSLPGRDRFEAEDATAFPRPVAADRRVAS
jgi:3',5'-cyclic AMP phosphodiesterase CpdA